VSSRASELEIERDPELARLDRVCMNVVDAIGGLAPEYERPRE
jgi:hypothetical protein